MPPANDLSVMGPLISSKGTPEQRQTYSGLAYTYMQGYTFASYSNNTLGASSVATLIPAGGVGTAAGGWDTAGNRDTAITTLQSVRSGYNNLLTDVELLKRLVNAIINDLRNAGICA